MQLLEFEVQGFKSLYDCKLTGLQPINVFHGENNVGKSNLLQAMELFFRLILHRRGPDPLSPYLSLQDFQDRIGHGEEMFSWGGDRKVVLRGLLDPPASPAFSNQPDTLTAMPPAEIMVIISGNQPDSGWIDVEMDFPNLRANGIPPVNTPSEPHESQMALIANFDRVLRTVSKQGAFYRIRSDRRFVRETMEPGTAMRPVELPPLDPSGRNLKQWLLWASVSRDPGERRAFERVIRPMFADPPLSLGTLAPVAAPGEPYDLQLDTPERSIPIDQVGSGVQQLALLGGMIALSQSWIVAIEEPEINLSWPTQEKLKHILRKMVQDTANPPTQFFLSSHSPVFEFYERFFRVEMEDGKTKVTSIPNERRDELFSTISEGRGTIIREGKTVSYEKDGIRLRSGNVVVLPDHVLEALGVSQGDAIYFHREGDRMLVLNGAQLEELWKPQENE
jgi:predicted ATPase